MPATGVKTFDSTLQLTNTWLDELMDEMKWEDRHRSYHGLRAVLHALRDRLTVDEAAHLSAQLPMLVRGIFFEGWHPADKPLKERKLEDFLGHIAEEIERDPTTDSSRLAKGVFAVLDRHITAGEIEDVKGMLPKELRQLWP